MDNQNDPVCMNCVDKFYLRVLENETAFKAKEQILEGLA